MSDATHRHRAAPAISASSLADFMAASEMARRTIVRNCRYQPIGRVIQHNEAKSAVSKFIRDHENDAGFLTERVDWLRNRLTDSAFERDTYDFNADYIARVAAIWEAVSLPTAQRIAPGKTQAIMLNGVRVHADLHVKLQRITKTNKVRIGGLMLRYAKNKALPTAVGLWQSAFLFGYLARTSPEEDSAPEHKLCITLDAWTGLSHAAPGDSISRFNNMEAACASIAERWPALQPPAGAVF